MQKKWSKKTSNSSSFSSEEKLSFCEECGGLMLPTKIGKNISFKCKCGSTKPFFENSTNSYKVTRKIKHSVNEESIYGCFCGKKFNSHSAFLEHSNTCQNHINATQIIKTKSKEQEFYGLWQDGKCTSCGKMLPYDSPHNGVCPQCLIKELRRKDLAEWLNSIDEFAQSRKEKRFRKDLGEF